MCIRDRGTYVKKERENPSDQLWNLIQHYTYTERTVNNTGTTSASAMYVWYSIHTKSLVAGTLFKQIKINFLSYLISNLVATLLTVISGAYWMRSRACLRAFSRRACGTCLQPVMT